MKPHNVPRQVVAILTVYVCIIGCTSAPPAPATIAPTVTSTLLQTASAQSTALVAAPATEPVDLWEDATVATIGTTSEWTNKVEVADITGDQLVDILFANGGDYETPGEPEPSRVFINQGAGKRFKEATSAIFGSTGMLARVIKVHDVTGDGNPDILVGATYQTQSRLYAGDGRGTFTDVTETSLPQQAASIGDLEAGDVDGDGDLDVVLADWGPGNPMENSGGRTMLWLNDGAGHFSDATDSQMPTMLVQFSWDLEFVDVDNDYDLDVLVACKKCTGSFLFENDGAGKFTDVSHERLPQFTNNYEFAAMDLNGDAYLDLVTINDGEERPIGLAEHVFLNNQHGGFSDATSALWPASENVGYDDNVVAFLDYDSDGDADFLIGSLDGPDRLLINDGVGHLKVATKVIANQDTSAFTWGTLGLVFADLNSDGKLDMVQGQGEAASQDVVFLGTHIEPDSAPPVISMVEAVGWSAPSASIRIHARVHDNASALDLKAVVVRWSAGGQTRETPLHWYGEYLWRGAIEGPAAAALDGQVCAMDLNGNEVCAPLRP